MNEDILIQRLHSKSIQHFTELIYVFEDVFEMKNFVIPNQRYLVQLLNEKNFHVFIALQKNKVIGGLTAYTLPAYYSESPSVYIYDLAVKTEFQRQGIGKMLITNVNDYCKSIGVEEVFVQADLEDAHAIEFYRSTGGLSENVIHFTYPLN
ncbi:GNAT family N-acetyltransferase [Dyadobacter sp. NIV53]|uniref:GNAT family N-acetyltransferase n=1 Tax=Dyadobacter sp. NIV53 TaxID=2861765 RepID=UPI001C87C175|nr:GNAT family N-acetyltransferase [Dyadobacter sp. NIV53]